MNSTFLMPSQQVMNEVAVCWRSCLPWRPLWEDLISRNKLRIQKIAWQQHQWERFRGIGWWKIQHKSAMCFFSQGQLYLGLHKRRMTSRLKDVIVSLYSTFETPPGVLCPVLESPTQGGHLSVCSRSRGGS